MTTPARGVSLDLTASEVPQIVLDSVDRTDGSEAATPIDDEEWLYRGKKVMNNKTKLDRLSRRTSKTGKEFKPAMLGRALSRREQVKKSRSFKRSQERSDGEFDHSEDVSSIATESPYGTAKRGGKDRRALQKLAVINRTQAREQKKNSADFSTPRLADSGDSDSLVMELTSSANFKTLREIKSEGKKIEPLSGTCTPRSISKSSETSSSENRAQFYKLFSLLLKANENAFRHQESATGSPQSQIKEERQKVKAGDLLFLYLTAWKAGLPIKGHRGLVTESLLRIDGELFRFRVDGQDVFKEIKNFRVLYQEQKTNGAMVPSRSFSTPVAERNAENDSLVANISRFSLQETSADTSGLWSDVSSEVNGNASDDICYDSLLDDIDCVELSESYIERQRTALEQVSKLLSEFENFTSYYPTYSLMREDADKLFIGTDYRLKVLYIWSNITRDLCRKTKQIGVMLEMRNGCDWPNIDYESPDCSPMTESTSMEASLSNMASSNSLYTQGRELGLSQTESRYRRFFESSLRQARSVIQRVTKIFGNTLFRARQALQVPKPISIEDSHVKIVSKTKKRKSQSVIDSSAQSIAASPLGSSIISKSRFLKNKESSPGGLDDSDAHNSLIADPKEDFDRDLSFYGVQNPLFRAMGLPTFLPSFLFLLRVPVNLVHQWLNLRRDQKPRGMEETDTSTLLQLIHDSRDVLDAAVEVKRFYQDNVQAVIGESKLKEKEKLLVTDMVDFEKCLSSMFEIYLEYINCWTLRAQAESRWNTSVSIEEEWKFASRVAIHIAQGEALAAKTFCNMAIRMFEAAEDFLESERLNSAEYPNGSEQGDFDGNSSDDSALDVATGFSRLPRKSNLFPQCRKFKFTATELRERALKALSFAKMLRKDLEIAAHFGILCSLDELLQRLAESQHVQVRTFEEDDRLLMFVRKEVAADEIYLNLLLNVTCGRDETVEPRSVGKTGYLILMKMSQRRNGLITHHWKGPVKYVSPDADTTIALSHIEELDGLYLVVVQSSALKSQRKEFQRSVREDCAVLIDEMCSCHQLIAKNMDQLKDKALQLRYQIADWLKEIQPVWSLEADDPDRHWRDAVLQGYKVGFEYHREIVKLVSGTKRSDLAVSLKDFSQQWMELIMETCEKGKGVWPRWASNGLNFLRIVLEPKFSSHFNDEEFEDFKTEMNRCVDHILGDTKRQSVTATSPLHKLSLPGSLLSSKSWPSAYGQPAAKGRSSQSTHSAPADEHRLKPNSTGHQLEVTEPTSPISTVPEVEDIAEMPLNWDIVDEKIHAALSKLETEREEMLLRKNKIGRVVERRDLKVPKISRSMQMRRVNFRYQITSKVLGQGSFGRVYQAVNMDANIPMAVKILDMDQSANQEKMMAYADEIINFEGIDHPNLVRYYGVEYHRRELLIFMELCNEGTLEKACKEGLPEGLVRVYTLEILNGVNELHQRNIIHRDLKPQNIFLAHEKILLKLGDFGSSIKLRSQQTGYGECRRYGGTTNYMSPEMVTVERNPSGYGRAIDIWAVGCIVLEMATGKVPYHGFEYGPTILKIGNGELPYIPESLSSDCKHFIRRCLVVNPEHRATVRELLEDPFVKINVDYLSPTI